MQSQTLALSHSDRALLFRILVAQEETLGIVQELSDLFTTMETEMQSVHDEIAELQTRVTANTSAVDSAKDVLVSLKTKLDEAIAALPSGTDVTDLQALSDTLGANTDALSAAVVANTPADPAPAPTP